MMSRDKVMNETDNIAKPSKDNGQLPPAEIIRNTDENGGGRSMQKIASVAGWLVAVAVPVLLWLSWKFVPMPGTFIAALAICGGYAGFLMYEHMRLRQDLHPHAIKEQLLLALLLLAAFSLII